MVRKQKEASVAVEAGMGMGIDLEPGAAEVRELSGGWILGGQL